MKTSACSAFSWPRQCPGGLRLIWHGLAGALVLLLLSSGLTQAAEPNIDTAIRRQDNTLGTRPRESGQTFIGTDPATGDQVMEAVPPPQDKTTTSMEMPAIKVYPVVPPPYTEPYPEPRLDAPASPR